MAKVDRRADLTRVEFFQVIWWGKKTKGDEGIDKGLKIINDDVLEAEFGQNEDMKWWGTLRRWQS